jgi:hypothetical protein
MSKIAILVGEESQVTVRLREGKVTCTCYIDCPGVLNGDVCNILTPPCFVGWQQLGGKTFIKEVEFGGITCRPLTLVFDYGFGFTADRITFFAVGEGGGVQDIGGTGCVQFGGVAVVEIPPLTVGLRTLIEYGCGANPNFNSSVDLATVTCST